MTVKEIRKLTGLSQSQFALKYHIPLSTLHKWEASDDCANHRDCPLYVIELLERAVKEDFDINKHAETI